MPAELTSIEGRLNAHRKLLVSIVDLLADMPAARSALQRVQRDHEVHRDHEEDPGIDPDRMYAVQRIASAEITAIIQAGMARNAANHGPASKPDGETNTQPAAERDAAPQFRQTRHGATNDGVSSAKPRVITGSDDATVNRDPPGTKRSSDWSIGFDETQPAADK